MYECVVDNTLNEPSLFEHIGFQNKWTHAEALRSGRPSNVVRVWRWSSVRSYSSWLVNETWMLVPVSQIANATWSPFNENNEVNHKFPAYFSKDQMRQPLYRRG